jgi:transcription elongation factor GreA
MHDRADYLTDEGRAKLEDELQHLRTVRRMEIAERIREAKAEGDVSENAGYEDAKHEQAFVEGRIVELDDLLKRAKRIADDGGNVGRVAVGSRVTVREDGYQPERYLIVGSAEADPSDGRISYQCPLGQALIGHGEGEEVQVKAPNGRVSVRILKIEQGRGGG